MSYTVRVYGPILNQSMSLYWSVLQMCILRTPNDTSHYLSCVPSGSGAAWKCLHGWIFSPPVRT